MFTAYSKGTEEANLTSKSINPNANKINPQKTIKHEIHIYDTFGRQGNEDKRKYACRSHGGSETF